MNSLKETQTLSERLPYFEFDKETDAIWLKDGSATLSLKITPKDCSSFTDEDLEILRFGLTPALGHLPEGAVFQAIMLRERSNPKTDEAFKRWVDTHSGDVQSDPRQLLLKAREEVLKSEFEKGGIFQTRCYITLRILPDVKPKIGKTLGVFSQFAFWTNRKKKSDQKTRSEILRNLESSLGTLRAELEALGFEISNVPHEERVSVIYEWLNPERAQTLPPPSRTDGMLSDRVALTDMIEDRTGLSLGRTRISLATMKSLPEISIPGVLGNLASAQHPFSLMFTVYVLNQTEERERLLRKQRLAQGMASGNTVRNIMAETQLRDIEDTLTALISSGEKLLAVSFHISGNSGGDR